MMRDDLDRAHEPLPTKVGADVRLQIRGAAVCHEEAGERLQPIEKQDDRGDYGKDEVYS